MATNSFIFYSVKIAGELIFDVLYFPLWWYSRGLVNIIVGVKDFLVNKQKSLALLVWIKNIFKPMYAQYDWQGMLISFFMRVIQIIFRSMTMLVWLVLSLAAIIFWTTLPALILYEITFQFI
ncbi:hypothetical protein A3H09_04020 [Candidatus Falkowbacteria bacterium RIFCSPLOWO2_12_FULL_45_13]|uniref:Uncharacterized protein n=2 Tax=Candidatus Falkowiibacteriota TaxID=1752728 RepID=A0A1F5SBA2_9BACT|nr:MAG: hypothetical protein A3H66_02610 [Candidatus Falkowbacteria bacterium RIFCSPLOWO2_02_FULL_45_21]OGF30507.1 MAG: hypothetical protein A3H09_04020 [Candidatus Falkowbacteria bacterium RIFCSPLOWO2_12_FULL_45_13]